MSITIGVKEKFYSKQHPIVDFSKLFRQKLTLLKQFLTRRILKLNRFEKLL